jgi:hypothetical protein
MTVASLRKTAIVNLASHPGHEIAPTRRASFDVAPFARPPEGAATLPLALFSPCPGCPVRTIGGEELFEVRPKK